MVGPGERGAHVRADRRAGADSWDWDGQIVLFYQSPAKAIAVQRESIDPDYGPIAHRFGNVLRLQLETPTDPASVGALEACLQENSRLPGP